MELGQATPGPLNQPKHLNSLPHQKSEPEKAKECSASKGGGNQRARTIDPPAADAGEGLKDGTVDVYFQGEKSLDAAEIPDQKPTLLGWKNF